LSSILTALRKLEKETSKSTEPTILPGAPDSQMIIRKRAKRKRSKQLSLFVALICMATLVAVWSLRKNSVVSPPLAPARKTAVATTSPPAPLKTVVRPTDMALKNNPPISKKSPPIIQKRLPLLDENLQAPLVPPATLQTALEKANNPAPTGKDLNQQFSSVLIKQDSSSDLSLQAITWSENAQKRFAVINGRIIRKGEVVNGFMIHRIREDDVVALKDGKYYRLTFRLR
jgi:hypothetical protein